MVELRALHFSDLHEDYAKLEAIQEFLSDHESIDVTLYSGDFIQCQYEITKDIGGFYDTEGRPFMASLLEGGFNACQSDELFNEKKEELVSLIEEVKTRDVTMGDQEKYGSLISVLTDLVAKKTIEVTDKTFPEKLARESYQKLADEFGKINEIAPICGVLGNHDLTIGYDALGDVVTFLETTEKAVVKGKSGIEFILKGDINSYEVPPLIGVITGIDNSFSRHFIDYDLGNSLDYVTEMAEKAKEGDDNSHYNDLLDSLPEKVKNEQKRLGSADDVDIYLTHKLPNCEKSAPKNRKVYGCPTGDIAKEYSEHASCTYGGHFHSMQVGDNFLETLLESNDFEIDEDGWNVIYVEDEQLKFINSAGDGFTVTEFDEDKSIECIMVYELIDVYD